MWVIWRRRITPQGAAQPTIGDGEAANSYAVPHDPVLADVLDNLRRELIAKLHPA